MGTLWERFTQKRMHVAPGFRGLQRRAGLRHEFESHRLRHIAAPQSPPFGGLCRFWGVGKGSARRQAFPHLFGSFPQLSLKFPLVIASDVKRKSVLPLVLGMMAF